MKKPQEKKKMIGVLIGASATIIAAFIMRGKVGTINTVENEQGNIHIINGGNGSTISITEIQSNGAIEQEDERERPYTVRKAYPCEQSGEPGKEYNLVCVDTRMTGSCYVTYYTYDVTYY